MWCGVVGVKEKARRFPGGLILVPREATLAFVALFGGHVKRSVKRSVVAVLYSRAPLRL